MKIAYFTDSFLPKFDGVSSVVSEWSELMARRHEVKVFAPAYSRKRSTEMIGNVFVERFPSVPVPTYNQLHLVIPDLLGEIGDEIQKFSPNVIHLHGPGWLGIAAMRIAQKKKIPLVGTYHTLLSEMLPLFPPFDSLGSFLEPENGDEGVLKKAMWGFTKLVYGKCDLIVSPAEAIKRELRKHNYKNWIEVVSNGINTDMFSFKKKLVMSNLILHAGRISFEKSIDVVIKAFALMLRKKPRLRLVIAGNGPALKSLEELVEELGIDNGVEFLGYVQRTNLINWYQKADLFLTASTMEVQPMVIMEAMSCGLPVVAVNRAGLVGGMVREMFNGRLIGDQNIEAFSQAAIEVLSNNTLWQKMRDNSRKTAEKNDIHKSLGEMEKLYRELIDSFK